jgi:hypothetical protein
MDLNISQDLNLIMKEMIWVLGTMMMMMTMMMKMINLNKKKVKKINLIKNLEMELKKNLNANNNDFINDFSRCYIKTIKNLKKR